MPCESPNRRCVSVQCQSLNAVGHEAQLLALRSPTRRSASSETSPPTARTRAWRPRSQLRKSSPYVGTQVTLEAKTHGSFHSPSRRPDSIECPTIVDTISYERQPWSKVSPCRRHRQVKEPEICVVVGHEAQFVNPGRSSRQSTASVRDFYAPRTTNRRGDGINAGDLSSQNSGDDSDASIGSLPRSPWVLHFATDAAKVSAFDEQVRGQLRTTGECYMLGPPQNMVNVGTYAKLCNASVHELIRAIGNRLQNVKVQKKPCEHLFKYLKYIDESVVSLLKPLDTANLSHGVDRLLRVLKESLADAYVLFKRCETRSPIHVNVLSNIPASLSTVEEEIQRIIPVLRLALARHQDVLTSQVNMERGAPASSREFTTLILPGDFTTPASAESSMKSVDLKSSLDEPSVSNGHNLSGEKPEQNPPVPGRSKIYSPWHVDVHSLKMRTWGTRTYLCKACHQVGNGCVFSCDECSYHIHPSCVELNQSIQQLEEVRINKLSMCDDPVERDLCAVV
ncbi:hypothetical protein R1flu_017341 [Riccia fluitans]|uniref:Phorbol-ester/DAG-type domain-containing protein n=1 Tax=Riccia fluitans TaxID=41844 RepID=A0ABD1ZCU0_9MARC